MNTFTKHLGKIFSLGIIISSFSSLGFANPPQNPARNPSSACVITKEAMSAAVGYRIIALKETQDVFGLPRCDYHIDRGLLISVSAVAPGGTTNMTVDGFLAKMQSERRSEATREVGVKSFNANNAINIVKSGRVLSVIALYHPGMDFGVKLKAAKAVAQAM